MREVVYRPRAALDIESAVIYVAEVLGNPQVARRIYNALMEGVSRLSDMPTLGKAFGDVALHGAGYRSFLVENYRVFYTYDEDTLTVWRVVHTRRDIDAFEFVEF